MRASIRSSTISRLAGAIAALWLCGGGTAWAGMGGGDFGGLLSYLSGTVCPKFNHLTPCPQPPTVTQGVLEVAALANNLPEMIRVQFNVEPGNTVTAGNPSRTPDTIPPNVSDLLKILTPLAFISQNPPSTTANATPLSNSSADAFLYAVAVGDVLGTGQPEDAYFIYDDLFRTNANGQIVAKFLFPLTVLDSTGNEREVSTQLNFSATNGGDCTKSGSIVVGDFAGKMDGTSQQLTPDQIGIGCTVVFSTSPASTQKHAIFQVTVPLLVSNITPTSCTPSPCTPTPIDLPYFWSNQQSGSPPNPFNGVVSTAFVATTPLNANNSTNSSGQPILGGQGKRIGLAPSARPLAPTQTNIFALCASLPVNTNGTGAQLRPAVGAYYAVETSGEMLLSAALPGFSPSFCPSLP